MRTLSATLEAAQKKAIGEPVARVVIDDRRCGMFRPRWELVAEDTVPDGPAATCTTYDAAIVRARTHVQSGGLYVQRVTDPTSAGQWTAWTLLESGVAIESQIALAWDGNTIQALFYVAGDGRTIKVRESGDNGQTWGAAATVTTLAAGHVCRSLAASLNSGCETLYCFFSDELVAAAGQAHLYSMYRPEAGGAWSTPQSWGRPAEATLHGLAVDGVGDLRIAAGVSGSLCTYTVPVGNLDAWPAPHIVLRSDSASIAYGWPSIALNFDQSYYIFFVESNAAAATSRLHHVIALAWDTPGLFTRPYAMTAAYGASALAGMDYHYLCTNRYVYRAARWVPGASQRVDVSADVHAVRLSERRDRPGSLLLTLRDDDGRYATVGAPGPYQAITLGSQVSVRLGYRTSAGEEVSYYRPFWVVTMVRQRRGTRRLLVAATDGWGVLEATPVNQGYAWVGETILALLTALLSSLGFAVTDDTNEAWSRTVSRFAINPGASLGDMVRYLLRLAGGSLLFRTDAEWEEHWPSAVAHLVVPAATSTYTYGAAHPIIAAEYSLAEQAATHVVALGEGQVLGEALDWAMIELCNEDRVRQVVDRRLATAAEAETRAGEELAAWQRATGDGHIIVPPNVGQEVLDAVTLSDSALGPADAVRLVTGNEVVLDREKGVFEQRLEFSRV